MWESYEGDFFDDQKSGRGKLKLWNGEVFIGEFKEDQVNGVGKYYRLTGEIISGKWLNGVLSNMADN